MAQDPERDTPRLRRCLRAQRCHRWRNGLENRHRVMDDDRIAHEWTPYEGGDHPMKGERQRQSLDRAPEPSSARVTTPSTVMAWSVGSADGAASIQRCL